MPFLHISPCEGHTLLAVASEEPILSDGHHDVLDAEIVWSRKEAKRWFVSITKRKDEMKPQNVLKHEHYFVYTDSDGLSLDSHEHIRYDACDTRDDGAGVWSPQSGKWWPHKDYERAKRVAKIMAETYSEYNPI